MSEPVPSDLSALVKVRYTEHFEADLASIESFWLQGGDPSGYDQLLELLDTVISNLERHPRLGRSFFSRQPESVEAQVQLDMLRAKMAADNRLADMREYVLDCYLVLYAVLDAFDNVPVTVYLASVKHHQQLSLEFKRHWT